MSNRAAPPELWDLAKSLVRTLFSVFGEPQEIAARGAVDRKTYLWLIAWLRACETLLRRLLLIEARTLGPPAPLVRRSAQSESGSPRKPTPFSLNPDDWRVSFRLIPDRRRPRRHPSAPALHGQPCPYPALPLAHRAEALFRVCRHPLPYVRRLARLIARAPQAIARILTRPHERKRKSGDPPTTIAIIGPNTWDRVDGLCADTS